MDVEVFGQVRSRIGFRPVQADVGLGVVARPPVEQDGKVLAHPVGWYPRLEYTDDDDVALAGEVLHVLGDQGAMFVSGDCDDFPIRSGVDAAVSDVDGVVSQLGEPRACAAREHLVDKEPHGSGRHEVGPLLGGRLGAFGFRVIGRNLGVDLLAM